MDFYYSHTWFLSATENYNVGTDSFLDGSLQKHDEFSETSCAGMWLMETVKGVKEERQTE